MGKRGPAKKPSALEDLQGRPGKRASNKKEPKPKTGIPPCPRWLDGIAKYAFKQLGLTLDEIKVLTKADQKALELLCDAYSEYRRARAFILENGTHYKSETKFGSVIYKKYPHVDIAANAWRRCADMLKQFGLTPSARTGVERIGDDEADPMEEFLKSGGKPKVVK